MLQSFSVHGDVTTWANISSVRCKTTDKETKTKLITIFVLDKLLQTEFYLRIFYFACLPVVWICSRWLFCLLVCHHYSTILRTKNVHNDDLALADPEKGRVIF